jgi:hypothetical protein
MFGENICICKEISKHGQENDAKSIVIQHVHSRKINRKRGCHTHYDLVMQQCIFELFFFRITLN